MSRASLNEVSPSSPSLLLVLSPSGTSYISSAISFFDLAKKSSLKRTLNDFLCEEFRSNWAQNSTGVFGGEEEDFEEKLLEARDESLDLKDEPPEDVDERVDVDP